MLNCLQYICCYVVIAYTVILALYKRTCLRSEVRVRKKTIKICK